MKNKTSILFASFMLSLMFVSMVSAETLYQENADNIVVGGYPAGIGPELFTDGDWDTFARTGSWTGGNGYLTYELTYNIPENVEGAIWTIKDEGGVYSLQIPEDCLGEEVLILNVDSNLHADNGVTSATWKCGNNILRLYPQSFNVYEEAVTWEFGEGETPNDTNYLIPVIIGLLLIFAIILAVIIVS